MSDQCRRNRKGATTVEMTFAAPILFLFVFSTIEFWQIHMYRNMASEAAYEGARFGVLPGAEADEVEDVALSVMDKVGANNSTVDVEPQIITNDTREVTVTVTVPLDSNGWIVSKFYTPNTIVRKSTLVRELAKFD